MMKKLNLSTAKNAMFLKEIQKQKRNSDKNTQNKATFIYPAQMAASENWQWPNGFYYGINYQFFYLLFSHDSKIIGFPFLSLNFCEQNRFHIPASKNY